MNDFMKGRNGADELTIVMGFAGIAIAMIGSLARVQWLSWIAIAVIVLGVLIYLLVRPYKESGELEVKYSAK